MLCKLFTFTNVPPNTRPPPRWCSLNAFVRLSLFNGTTKPFRRLYPSHTAHRTKQMSSSCWENVYSKKREGKKPQWHLQMRGNWNPSWKAPSMLFWLQTEKKERTRNNGSVRTIFFFFTFYDLTSDSSILITSFVLRLTKDMYVYMHFATPCH